MNHRGEMIVTLAAWLILVQFAAAGLGIAKNVMEYRESKKRISRETIKHCEWAKMRYSKMVTEGKLTQEESLQLIGLACEKKEE